MGLRDHQASRVVSIPRVAVKVLKIHRLKGHTPLFIWYLWLYGDCLSKKWQDLNLHGVQALRILSCCSEYLTLHGAEGAVRPR